MYISKCAQVSVECEEPIPRDIVKSLIYCISVHCLTQSSGRTAATDKLHINAQTQAYVQTVRRPCSRLETSLCGNFCFATLP